MKKKKLLVIIDVCADMPRDDIAAAQAHLLAPDFSVAYKPVVVQVPRHRLTERAMARAMAENGVDVTRTYLVTSMIDSVITARDVGIKSIGIPFEEKSVMAKYRIARGFTAYGATATHDNLATVSDVIKRDAESVVSPVRSRVPVIKARGTRGPTQG